MPKRFDHLGSVWCLSTIVNDRHYPARYGVGTRTRRVQSRECQSRCSISSVVVRCAPGMPLRKIDLRHYLDPSPAVASVSIDVGIHLMTSDSGRLATGEGDTPSHKSFLDLMVRTSDHGDLFGQREGLTLQSLIDDFPHGYPIADYDPLSDSHLAIAHEDRKLRLCTPEIAAEFQRLLESAKEPLPEYIRHLKHDEPAHPLSDHGQHGQAGRHGIRRRHSGHGHHGRPRQVRQSTQPHHRPPGNVEVSAVD